MKIVFSCLGVCLLIVTAAFAAEAVREESIAVDVLPGDQVEIYTINGNITAENWDSDEVEIIYIITCDTEEELDFISVDCNTSDGIVCQVEYDDNWDDSFSGNVDFNIKLPSDIDLNLDFASVNGNLILLGGDGEALLEAVNGDIEAESFDGELSIHCVNGDILVSDSPGIRIAELVNGNIECIVSSLEEDLELAAVNGYILLDLSTDAEVEIETISGNIDIDDIFNAEIMEELVGSSSEFGSGQYRIEITTVSGDISVEDN
jgi:DUF4097 and DUF4098 domain-containing protein YvlB